MRITAFLLSAFFLAILTFSPTPSFSQKDQPAQFVIDDALHFEASVPEIEPLVPHDLSPVAEIRIFLSAAGDNIKCISSDTSPFSEVSPRRHLKLRVFRN